MSAAIRGFGKREQKANRYRNARAAAIGQTSTTSSPRQT
jgi:hypothetical protein